MAQVFSENEVEMVRAYVARQRCEGASAGEIRARLRKAKIEDALITVALRPVKMRHAGWLTWVVVFGLGVVVFLLSYWSASGR